MLKNLMRKNLEKNKRRLVKLMLRMTVKKLKKKKMMRMMLIKPMMRVIRKLELIQNWMRRMMMKPRRIKNQRMMTN